MWYAARTITGQEDGVAQSITDDIASTVWVPRYRTLTKPTKKRKPVVQYKVLMPGYVMVVDPDWPRLRRIKGVVGWISTQGEPLPVRRERDITRLQEQERIGAWDDDALGGRIRPGDLLDVLFGPLDGRQVTFIAAKGADIDVEVDFFGAKRKTTVRLEQVKLAG